MKKMTKVIIITVCVLFLWFVVYGLYGEFVGSRKFFLHRFGSCLKLYIWKEGSFPSSRDDFIDKGYLVVISDNQYEVKSINGFYFDWPKVDLSSGYILGGRAGNGFGEFNISYGAKVEDLMVCDGVLVDRRTKKPFLLIGGPYEFLNRRYYRRVNLDLYEEMLRQRNKNSLEAEK